MADPELRLYNTLTRKIEPFTPEDGKTVRMYTCGPTVYRPAHLGNFRTFLFEDLLRRVIALRGWKLFQVMNLTDVDDKIIKSASEQGKSIGEVTGPVTETFHRDRSFLRIQDAELYPKATEHIPEMIGIVEKLVERKLAYLAVENFGMTPGIEVNTATPWAAAARQALADEYGRAPVMMGCGGSIPVVESLHRILGIDTLLMGFGLDDDAVHGPNEKFELACFHHGLRAHIRLLGTFATIPNPA